MVSFHVVYKPSFVLCFCKSKALLLWSLSVVTLTASSSLRIIGGRDATADEFPYVVRLEQSIEIKVGEYVVSKNFHICTASALSPIWTLTAEHCLVKNKPYYIANHIKWKVKNVATLKYVTGRIKNITIVIRYGSLTGAPTSNDLFSIVIRTRTIPTKRSYYYTTDDIMLLRTEPINIAKYAKISAVDYRTLYGQEVLVVGYGLTNYSDSNLYNTLELQRPLQVVKAMVNECDRSFVFPSVCLFQACGRPTSLCPGDSGGPVVHPSGVIALNARAPALQNCQMANDKIRDVQFGIALPLSSYINWISDVFSDNNVI